MCIANTYYGLKILKLHYLHFGYFHDILTVPFPHSSFLVMASWIDYSVELSQNLCCAIYVAFRYNGSYYFSFLISQKKHFNKKLQVIEYAHLKYFFAILLVYGTNINAIIFARNWCKQWLLMSKHQTLTFTCYDKVTNLKSGS